MKIFAILCVCTALAATADILRAETGGTGAQQELAGPVRERFRDAMRRYAATPPRNPLYPKEAMPLYTARLLAGARADDVAADVGRMMDAAMKDKLDPFHLHAVIHGERVGGKLWPDELRQKFRAYAARYGFTKPAGVSLNYELMRDGAGWIAAGVWPDLTDADGNDAKRIRELCAKRLRQTLAAIPREGDTEYNAPLYHGTDFMALRLLVDFADDPALQQAARGALEAMLVDTAAHWHRGYAVTSAGRAKYWGSQAVSPDSPGATTAMAWLFFGGDRDQKVESVPQGVWMAYPSPWLESAGWLPRWQASLPVPRHVRASVLIPSKGYKVRKEAWITDGYGLASQRTDGTSQKSYLYKECRNVILRWVSPKPASTFIVYQENRRRPHELIANAFAYGENPYAQTLQHEGTVIALHDVPPDYGFHRVIAPFTTRGAINARLERAGWVCAHGGSVLFAFRHLTPAAWLAPEKRERLDLYAADSPRGGWILETSPVAPFAGGTAEDELSRFADALAARTEIEADLAATPPRLRFANLAGHRLEIAWKPPGEPYHDECKVDGAVVDYSRWPRLDVPGTHFSQSGLPEKSVP